MSPSMFWVAVALMAAFNVAMAGSTAHSFGMIVSCPATLAVEEDCLWAGDNGELLSSLSLSSLLLHRHLDRPESHKQAARNLKTHMTYIEAVHRYAQHVGHAFSYSLGVSERHLMAARQSDLLPEALVHREMAARTRRLQSTTGSTSSSSSEFNWCSTNNPMGHSVCSVAKSQQSCGSCWSFAAADSIEAAVAIAANQSAAVALSPQQFLTCSTRAMTQTFEYCWATGGVSSATWVDTEIKWASENDGCNGGMTHAAFMDAAQNGWGLLTELELPYVDGGSSSSSSSSSSSASSTATSNDSCSVSASEAAASITGWAQAIGTDCTNTSSASELLRAAVETQPIAVAMTSAGLFQDYAGGFYSCPNDGDLSSKDDINHALVLVGYGTDASAGDYWIIKNSYGSSWGANGFMKLLADSKLNCGLNIFPVIPTGATAGAAATSSVDGGGDVIFVGLSVTAWIAVAAVTTVATIVATSIGVMVSNRKIKRIFAANTAEANTSRSVRTPVDL